MVCYHIHLIVDGGDGGSDRGGSSWLWSWSMGSVPEEEDCGEMGSGEVCDDTSTDKPLDKRF
jgi:hypothetical protein